MNRSENSNSIIMALFSSLIVLLSVLMVLGSAEPIGMCFDHIYFELNYFKRDFFGSYSFGTKKAIFSGKFSQFKVRNKIIHFYSERFCGHKNLFFYGVHWKMKL